MISHNFLLIASDSAKVLPSLTSRLNPSEWIALIALLFTIFTALAWLIFRSGRTFEAIKNMGKAIKELKPLVNEISLMSAKVEYHLLQVVAKIIIWERKLSLQVLILRPIILICS